MEAARMFLAKQRRCATRDMVLETVVKPPGTTMNKLLTTTAVAFVALMGLPGTGAQAGLNVRIKLPADFSSVQKAGCYDRECEYDAVERDDDNEYERSDRYVYQRASRQERPTVRAESKRHPADPVAVATPEPEPQPPPAKKIAKPENSSIATAGDEITEPSTAKSKVAQAREVGCKSFFASAGMTLSVPCE